MGKILVADDEPGVRSLLTDLLEEAGHEAIEAENGQVAVQQVPREVPDLVLLDVIMPLMSGIQVLHRLREDPATERLPVIMLTAFFPSDELSGVLDAPHTYLVTKPWRRGMLKSAVDSALAQAMDPVLPQTNEGS
ncbi:MAG: response regulator [Chloroflexi bacterium]|nr:response regulator [Chloroflexota bacterium]